MSNTHAPSSNVPGRGRGGGRRPRPQRVLVVQRSERLTPHLTRIHLGGPDVKPFLAEADPDRLNCTDKYVKMLIAKPELGLTPPFDLQALSLELPAEQLPAQRTYTVRTVDDAARTITVDFVIHGDEGAAGPWAANAQPGDLLALSGPGGGYRPSQDADTEFLFLGDDAALPAIASTLEAVPPDATGTAIIEVYNAADEIDLHHPAGVRLQWVHRAQADGVAAHPYGAPLVQAVQTMKRPVGAVEVFAHSERAAMHSIRAVLQDMWKLDRRAMSLSAYWALGRAEDRFQAEKREPVGQIFTE